MEHVTEQTPTSEVMAWMKHIKHPWQGLEPVEGLGVPVEELAQEGGASPHVGHQQHCRPTGVVYGGRVRRLELLLIAAEGEGEGLEGGGVRAPAALEAGEEERREQATEQHLGHQGAQYRPPSHT